MSISQHVELYIIAELVIKLADKDGNILDSATTYDVPVTVHFGYEPGDDPADFPMGGAMEDGDELDPPQVYVSRVIAAVELALQAERMTLNIWQGCDVIEYLRHAEIDVIEEEMLRRAARNKADGIES